MNKLPPSVLPLKFFIQKQMVIDLYRKFFHLTRDVIDEQQRKLLQEWIRSEFRSFQAETDQELIRMQLNRGKNQLESLRNSLIAAHALKSSKPKTVKKSID
ncbi:hypothetical protein NH340_JMT08201 [Sarcoptes scabiei]|nr:hypothetical protein NH340_JMT08201 [Sarcoptes scabiei]